MLRNILFFSLILPALGQQTFSACRATVDDPSWPSETEWSSLNASINGALIKTVPAASSCYPGNPFGSSQSCDEVQHGWGSAAYHASLPESIDYPIYANNSCLPPDVTGYVAGNGCEIGGMPRYVVNATDERQIATAMAWAAARNIRIVVKGTGHDMNGRSSGANALSIWTHNLNHITYNPHWPLPGGNGTEAAIIVGSGNNWGRVYSAVVAAGRSVVGGGDATVGLGGFIQGGGHGALSSTYGLAADNILQATVVTTNGSIIVCNENQAQDLLWAIRGGGPGQYGVVTEYVLKTHPAPASVAMGTLALRTNSSTDESVDAVWNAYAVLVQSLPDLMDAGVAGSLNAATGEYALALSPSSSSSTNTSTTIPPGVVVSAGLIAYNKTAAEFTRLIQPVIARMQAQGGSNAALSVTWSGLEYCPSYAAYYANNSGSASSTAGQLSLLSSRLLGRAELLDDITTSEVASYLRRILQSKDETGSMNVIGLQGGPGPANVPENMRGALNPVWRSAYLHVITMGSGLNIKESSSPSAALQEAGEWMELNRESIWRSWAPETGAYMNEANPFNSNWKQDFYGVNYDRLLEIKRRYDPTESLYVLNGVESDWWHYDLDSGRLCRKLSV